MRTLSLHPPHFQHFRKKHLACIPKNHPIKETPMTRKFAKSGNNKDLSRCRHISPSGRRCRLSLCSDSRFYCRNHAHLQPPAGAVVDLSAELTAGLKKLTSASDINKFISKLLALIAEDRISPRRASVLIYACNLLLRTLPAIELEHQRNLASQRRNFT
jgi:hypothetical protein